MNLVQWVCHGTNPRNGEHCTVVLQLYDPSKTTPEALCAVVQVKCKWCKTLHGIGGQVP